MVKCELCNKDFKSLKEVALHIAASQKCKMSGKEYYLRFLGKQEYCPNCGKECNFFRLTKGFYKHCSIECLNKSKDHKEKSKDTMIKKYGVDNISKVPESRIKAKNTMIERYGGNSPLTSPIILEKIKSTMIEKYGVDNPKKSEEINKKIEQTCLERYGSKNPIKTEEIKEKVKSTNLKKYGKEYVYQSSVVKKKIKKTNLEKYGNEIYSKSDIYKIKCRKDYYNKLLETDRLKNICIPNFPMEEYDGIKKIYSWTCSKCGATFEDNINNGRIPRCLTCNPIYTSIGESEVLAFCKEYLDDSRKDNVIINPNELDIFIPSKNIAIEYNGLYWHSELNGKDKKYHLDKTLKCKEKGIQLLHIFEDEWINKQEIVKSIIKSKLGILTNKKFARKLEILEVSGEIASVFLSKNHVQGSADSRINICLTDGTDIYSILSLSKPRYNKNYEYELIRFCNLINFNIVGGFSKMLRYFERKYEPKSILTYSDLRYGVGDVYEKNGFEFVNTSQPNYFYLDSSYSSRYSRIRFQKHKLSKIFENVDIDTTEWEIMRLNGYDRIWDCGNCVYKKIL
jgi:hypothetical protein